MFRKLLAALEAHDIAVVVFAVFLSVVCLVFSYAISEWPWLVTANLLGAVLVILLAHRSRISPNKFVTVVHHWYPMAAILLTFKALYFVILPIHGRDYDDLLIAIDRWMFGVDPTVWIHKLAHPLLTEILQIAYASFYFLFIIIAIELYRNGRMKDFLFFAFLILFGFYLSYVGYFFLPAVGPRFTLHDFYSTDSELPGLLFAKPLRDFVNFGESIPAGVSNPALFTQRDVFPSGHTMMTLVMIYFVWRFRLKTKIFITVVGSLLIVATVYLRYHYVIDLAAGALFAALCIWWAPNVYRSWERIKESQLTPVSR